MLYCHAGLIVESIELTKSNKNVPNDLNEANIPLDSDLSLKLILPSFKLLEWLRLSCERQNKQLLECGNNILLGRKDVSHEGAVNSRRLNSAIHPTQ